jgi:hypothetical protein
MNQFLTNKTYNIGYENKGFLDTYNIKVGGIHSNTVDGPKKNDFSFIKGTNTILLTLGGIDLDFSMEDVSARLLIG